MSKSKAVSALGTPNPAIIFQDNRTSIQVAQYLGGTKESAIKYSLQDKVFTCGKCAKAFSTRRKFLIHLFSNDHLPKIICYCSEQFTYTTFMAHIKKNEKCRTQLCENQKSTGITGPSNIPETEERRESLLAVDVTINYIDDSPTITPQISDNNPRFTLDHETEKEMLNYASWSGSPQLPGVLIEKIQKYNEQPFNKPHLKQKKSKAKIPKINKKPNFRFEGVKNADVINAAAENTHLQFYSDLRSMIEIEYKRVAPSTEPTMINGIPTRNVEKRVNKIKPKDNNTKLRVLSKIRQLLKFILQWFDIQLVEFHIGLLGYYRIFQLMFNFQFECGYEVSTISNTIDDFKYVIRFLKTYQNKYRGFYLKFYSDVFDFLCTELINTNRVQTRRPVECFDFIVQDCVSIAQLNIEEGANLDDTELSTLFYYLVMNFNNIQTHIFDLYSGKVMLLDLDPQIRFRWLIFLYESQLILYHLLNCAFIGQRTQIIQNLTYNGFCIMSETLAYHPTSTEKTKRKDQVIALPLFAAQLVQVQYIIRQSIITIATNHQMDFKKTPSIEYGKQTEEAETTELTIDLENDKFPIVDSRCLWVNFSGKICVDSQFEVDSATFFQYRFNKDIHITPSQTHRRNMMSKMNLGKLENLQVSLSMDTFNFKKLFLIISIHLIRWLTIIIIVIRCLLTVEDWQLL